MGLTSLKKYAKAYKLKDTICGQVHFSYNVFMEIQKKKQFI